MTTKKDGPRRRNQGPPENRTPEDTPRTSWLESWNQKGFHPRLGATYVYERPDGLAIVRKKRWALHSVETGEPVGKTFSVQHRPLPAVFLGAPMWERGIGEWGEGLMYNRPALDKALPAGEDIYWCEGEKDADNAARAWGVCTTTHYQGGAGARRDQAEVFAATGDGRVFLVLDNDDVGVQLAWRHAKLLVAAGVSPRRVRFLAPALAEPKADLSDHIAEGLDLEDLRPVGAREMRAQIKEVGELPAGNRFRSYTARELAWLLRERGGRPW
jgi:hypothetical protein